MAGVKRNYQWAVLALFLIAVSAAITWQKIAGLGFPTRPDMTTETWSIQAKVELERRGGPVKVALRLPSSPPGYVVAEEHYISRGFGLTIDDSSNARQADWAIRRLPEDRTLYYRARITQGGKRTEIAGPPAYPAVPELQEPFRTALIDIVTEVRQASADTRTFTAAMLAKLNSATPNESVALFLSEVHGPQDRIELIQTLLAGARIPTLQIHGFVPDGDIRRVDLQTLVGVYNDQQWLVFDPRDGRQGLPERFFIWSTGSPQLVAADGAQVRDFQVSVRKQMVSSLELASERAAAERVGVGQVSILQLPIQTQAVYEILLLVPFGILVIVIMRNVVGFSSFGTFAPVLIALAFRETELLRGLALFVLIVAMGLFFRFYLERLRLLLVPRLAAVVTIVVLLMTVISIVSNHYGIDTGLSVSLFPMIIISMVIERMSVVWEERGALTSIREGIGSLVMAALAYVVMSIDMLGYWVAVFPEVNLAVLGLIIMLGRYTGFRVTELFRFRQLDPTPGASVPDKPRSD